MSYDVIIIGAGSIGMATGYYLTNSGKRVLLLDKNNPPHTDGSHHGDTRIIRHAYGEGEKYVNMALTSQKLWKELEAKTKKNIFIPTGVLNVGKKQSDFIQSVIQSAEKHSLPLDVLSAEEIHKRWGGFNFPKSYVGCYESTSGVLKSEECISVYKNLALLNGAQLKINISITSMDIKPNKIKITTNAGIFTASQLIITAGAGTNELLSLLGIKLPLEETRQTFSWFNNNSVNYDDENFPAFVAESEIGTYYGFPSMKGGGVKIGRHDMGELRDMKKKIEAFGTYENDIGDVTKFTRKFLSNSLSHQKGLACTYTRTPDDDFIIDRLPGHVNAWIACGFSGHGFKFSSAIGKELSKMITKKRLELDLDYFRLERFK